MTHVAQDGTLLWQGSDSGPAVAANPADGSCWVFDVSHQRLVHIGVRALTVTASANPSAVPSGGTTQLMASVVDTTGQGVASWSWSDGGAGGSFSDPTAQNPTYTAPASDTRLTVTLQVTVTSSDPSPLTATGTTTLTVDPALNHKLSVSAAADPFLLASGGTTKLCATASDSEGHGIASWSWSDRGAGGSFSDSAAPNTTYTAPSNATGADRLIVLTMTVTCDGSSPLFASGAASVLVLCPGPLHTAGTVATRWESEAFSSPQSVSVNTADGSCWVADTGLRQVVHLSADGTELWRGRNFSAPGWVSVNSADGSCWVADRGDASSGRLVHLASDGTELWQGTGGLVRPDIVSVNPADGSCWASGCCSDQVVHLAADGTVLLQRRVSSSSPVVAVNPADGSCWVLQYTSVLHLAADGSQLCVGGIDLSCVSAVAVNPTDGSVWVTDHANGRIVHLDRNGNRVFEGDGLPYTAWLAVNPVSGAVWVSDCGGGKVALFTASGAPVWQSDDFTGPVWSVSVNPSDGSCWVADAGTNTTSGRVVHLGLSYLIADFTATPLAGPAPLTVQFTDASTGNPTAWAWSFGDGGTSTEQNPSHIYAFAGKALVSLTATDAAGSDTVTKADYIVVNHAGHELTITANCTPYFVNGGGTTAVAATAVDSEGHGISSWVWSDGGRGGHFNDPTAASTTYTAPSNNSCNVLAVPLTVDRDL